MARITIEDCLKHERNRFSLALLAARRAKSLLAGKTPVSDSKDNKSVVTALREIADGKVRFLYPANDKSTLSIPSEQPVALEPEDLAQDTH